MVRATPIAAISRSVGMVSATRALRIARSDGRTRPEMAASTNTTMGLISPVSAKVVTSTAIEA